MPPAATKAIKKLSSEKPLITAKKLNQIIQIQSRLAAANFNLPRFMNLIVKQMQILTPATGVVIELVDGKDMVYEAATGTVANHLGLRLPMNNSICGDFARHKIPTKCYSVG